MPASDRLNAANSNGKTLRPTLASNRTSKTPLTPKLAAASGVSSTRSAGATPRSAAKDDPATPAPVYLTTTVTPRSSSSRTTRASSSHSTPTGTPTTPSAGRHGFSTDSYTSAGPTLSAPRRPRSVVSSVEPSRAAPRLAPTPAGYSRPSSEVGARDKDAMFFHASEARSQAPTAAPVSKKPSPMFFHTHGKQEHRNLGGSGAMPSPPLSAVERARPNSESQFFHADSIPDARHSAPLQSPPILSPTSEPHFPPNAAGKDSPLQPPSPQKDNVHMSLRKGTSHGLRPNMLPRPVSSSTPPGTEQSTADKRRFSAENTGLRFGHGRNSSSLSSIGSLSSCGARVSAFGDHPGSPAAPSPLHVDITSPSTVQSPGSKVAIADDDDEQPTGLQSPLSLPQSPAVDPPQNTLQKMNELAANARRERKVLDLEISNSSLLAINRQLEREVRKQKAELKRFRRLSRAGRLASAGTGRSLSSVTEGETAEFAEDLDEFDGEDEGEGTHDEHDDHEELSSDESSIDEGALSPNALAERDAKYRFQDQRRLQLDLSKHRELLVDSQKMNQSLKRCIGWTEDLIKEAKKALEHQVRVSDVRLGGRILTREEQHGSDDDSSEEEDGPHGGSLLSPWTHPDNNKVRTSLESERLTDRDSGIELEGPKLQPDYFNKGSANSSSSNQLGQSF